MYSAFLLMDEGWFCTNDFDRVLNHEGEFLVNESVEDEQHNLAVLGAREGQIAVRRGNRILFSQTPIRNNVEAALADYEAFGSARLWSAHEFFAVDDKRYIYRSGYYYNSNLDEKLRGFIVLQEGNTYKLVRDEKAWQECQDINNRKKTEEYHESLLKPPSKYSFWETLIKCAANCGCSEPRSVRIEQLWVWVVASDVACGRRKTNQSIRDVAMQWCNNREKSKKWLSRANVDKAIVDKLDRRLAKVLRLGNRNSRHKNGLKAEC